MNIGLQFRTLGYSIGRTFGPVTLTDWYGIKMRVYPYEQTPLKKLITRENYRHEFSMYKKYARGTVLDIGANIGVHSVFLSRLADKVYAFEPVPDTLKRLEETIGLNKATNIIPVGVAVGEKEESATIQLFDDAYSSWNSFYIPDSAKKPTHSLEVPVTTLDAFAAKEKIDRIDFIKIDVEGHEMSVLKGAQKLLSEKRIQALAFEVTEMHGKETREIFSLLEKYGFTTEEYDPKKIHHNYYAVLP